MEHHRMLPLVLLVLQIFSHVRSQEADCQTPHKVPGNCIDLTQCHELMTILRESRVEDYSYLRQSRCRSSSGDVKVCCPMRGPTNCPSGTTVNPHDDGESVLSTGNPSAGDTWSLSNPLLPQSCGEDLTPVIVSGEKTDIVEFPWMALLEYNTPRGKRTPCGGVLISKRYVLTAAHCVKGRALPKSWILVSVRLGEYDTSTKQDCIRDGDGKKICADTPLSVRIEEEIVHDDFEEPLPGTYYVNDIALLRLSRDVSFTNFIRPICLPPDEPVNDSFFYAAGWGETESRSESTVKLKLKIPLADRNHCANVYQAAFRIRDTQLCAGGERYRDTCRGDSGGPLMTVIEINKGRLQWTVVGIVSFGPYPCGKKNWPGVYTNVTSLMPWIMSKLRA